MEGKIQCLECKKWFASITSHIKVHKLSPKDYNIRYPGTSLVSEEYINKHRQNSLTRYRGQDADMWKRKATNRIFEFVHNKQLSSLLQRDFRSAKVSLKNKLWKPSIILYGSIIEAILIEKYPEAKDFYTALNVSYENKDISEKEFHKIHLVRDLRNFVHLHKELSEGEEINEYWAKTFADICEAIIKRFAK